jgi:hypothetical protein
MMRDMWTALSDREGEEELSFDCDGECNLRIGVRGSLRGMVCSECGGAGSPL